MRKVRSGKYDDRGTSVRIDGRAVDAIRQELEQYDQDSQYRTKIRHAYEDFIEAPLGAVKSNSPVLAQFRSDVELSPGDYMAFHYDQRERGNRNPCCVVRSCDVGSLISFERPLGVEAPE